MVEGICRFCNNKKKLCKAHIIPETFYNIQNKSSYLGLSKNGTIDCIYSQNGLKDPNILCPECDAILGNYDKYAAVILKNEIFKYPMILEKNNNEQLYLLSKDSFNYVLLRKFFISLVWRASISNLCSVSLGKYEDIALKILKDEIQDDENLFNSVIFHKPKEYIFSDLAYIADQRFLGQKGMLITFPEYQISVITNCYPIRNNRTFNTIFSNSESLVVIETLQDLNHTQNTLSYIVKQIKNKNGGKLPNIGIK